MKKKNRLPLPGQRIYRSSIAVAFCLLIYVLRGYEGTPMFSAFAALQCIQPYTKDMKLVARKRILGTLIGAFWGLFQLLFEIELIRIGMLDEGLHYVIVPLMLIPLLYSTTLLKVQETAYFSSIVFLSITINHFTPDSNPYLFAFNRLLDTVIGVMVASVVNRLHLPRRKNTDTLYVSSLGHGLLDSNNRPSAFSLVELNRLMDNGAKFTISTDQTPARVRELLPGVRLRYPIITMDGAALYDVNSLEYIRTIPMDNKNSERIMRWLRENEVPFFTNTIEQNLLMIRYAELENKGMQQLFEKKRYSPYRNFIKSASDTYHHVVYLSVLETHERIATIYENLMNQTWIGEHRVAKTISDYEGYSFLKIYDVSCTQEAMLFELEKLMGTKETVKFGDISRNFDVSIEKTDRDLLVKELKRHFEPVDFRCWKTVFRW